MKFLIILHEMFCDFVLMFLVSNHGKDTWIVDFFLCHWCAYWNILTRYLPFSFVCLIEKHIFHIHLFPVDITSVFLTEISTYGMILEEDHLI